MKDIEAIQIEKSNSSFSQFGELGEKEKQGNVMKREKRQKQ